MTHPLFLDRRTVLSGLGAMGAAALLPSCHGSSSSSSSPGGTDLVAQLESLRDLVRSSPDHLSARAAQVIGSRDFTAAVRFVRDNVAVLPPSHSYEAAVDAVRWGPDATLRAGAGTQRERTELLKAMLVAMGATARVVDAPLPPALDASAIYAVQPPRPSVDPATLQALSSELRAQLVHVNDAPPDPDPSPVLTSLLALIPTAQAVAADPFDGVSARVPVVEYSVNGTTRWAFALGGIDEVTSAPANLGSELAAPSYPLVSVRLLGALGDLPGVPSPAGLVELAAAQWTLDQIAGTRLLIGASSPDPATTLGAPSDQITLRVPVLEIGRPAPLTDSAGSALWSPSKGSAAPSAIIGAPFTLSGGQFQSPEQPTDPVTGPYGALSALDPTAHAAALSSVATLSVTASGGAFPDVQLGIAALDGSGNVVPGLVEADFLVTDEGTTQWPTLVSNAAVPDPRVLLAYDCSGSVQWPSPGDKAAFDTALATACVTAAASKSFLLGAAPLGSAPPGGYVTPDATQIESVIGSCVSFSPIWDTLGRQVPTDGVSAAVIVSDFEADDDPPSIPALQSRAGSTGVALALVPVSNQVDQTLIDTLVNTLGAVVLDHTAPDFQQKLTDFLVSASGRLKASAYRSSYRLASEQQTNQATRTVNVSLVGRSTVAASTTYTVPPPGSRGNLGIAGLYVELRIGDSGTIVRHVSGPQLDRFGNPVAAVPADFDDTRALLGGIISIAFEPGSPTVAQNTEDLLDTALSLQAFQAAAGNTRADGLAAAGALRVYHAALSTLVDHQPAPPGTSVIAPRWARVVVSTEVATQTSLRFTTDIVPELNRSVAATTDGTAAFRDTLRSTLTVSLREALAMQSSSAGVLAAKPLQYLAPSADPSTLSGFTPADLARWQHVFNLYGSWHLLVPRDPSVPALWVVDPGTGSAVAVSIDGSGQGSNNCNQLKDYETISRVLALLQLVLARIVLECGASKGLACTGAQTAGAAATAVAAFAGLVYTGPQAPDAAAAALGFVSLAFGPEAGFAATLVGVLYTLISSAAPAECL